MQNKDLFVALPSSTYLFTEGVEGFPLAIDHTQTHTTISRTPLDEGSAPRRDLYLTTQTLYKRQTSMPPGGFEPTIPASARPQTYALDHVATWSKIKIFLSVIKQYALDMYGAVQLPRIAPYT
jgi:hypothetical protein